jgi:hypothetical protein
MNRARADRMTQAETVWALREPEPWPASAADTARKNVLLYTEHTWAAWNSISKPEADFVKEQWAIQRGYAEEEDRLSRALLARASAGGPSPTTFDVVNTLSWPRTDVVRVPPALSVGDDRVLDVVVTSGLDRVDLATTIDKLRAPAGPKGDYYEAARKESISLAFPFNVPGGQVRLELPIGGVSRPDADQIAGSCKN